MLRNIKKEIADFAASLGIKHIGVCSAERDEELLFFLEKRRSEGKECEFTESDLQKRVSPKFLLNDAKSVIVCLFPYYRDDFSGDGNISRYATVTDYHQLALEKLSKLADFLKKENQNCECICHTDSGVLADRHLAYRAGLGFYGKNNCLINDELGSYFFIGYIVTTLFIEPDMPLEKGCADCGECIKKCPGNALGENFSFNPQMCISYITQIKETSEIQNELLKRQNSVWGCDVCQDVCPHNRGLSNTALAEFSLNSISNLDFEEISKMSNRQFRKTYKNFAFSWRGKDVILKNFVGGTYVKQRKDNG